MKERIIKIVNLQLFAEVNMNVQTTGTSALSAEMKTFYDMTLIDLAEPELVHAQFGQKRPIPKNGGKIIEFRQFSSLPKALTPLTEGVTPNGRNLTVTAKTATVSQFGDYITVSDLLELTSIDPVIVEATKLTGSQAGRTLDTIVRNILVGGTNVYYQPKSAGTAVTSRAGLDATCTLTPATVRKVAGLLKRVNAKTIDGKYVAIIHPDVATDLQGTTEWQEAQKYVHPENIYNGEIGELYGVRFVETSEAKIWNNKTNDGTPEGLAVYGCLFLGANAYGVTDIEGGGLEHIVKQKGSAGTADPLNQRSTIGWKENGYTACRLVEEYMVRVECTSSLSASAEAN
jgi:N4-gp56 family major capsid protein